MKITSEITQMIEEALLNVRYKTHMDISGSQGATNNVDVLRERIVSDALNLLKQPIDNFVEKHFIVEIQREVINGTNQA